MAEWHNAISNYTIETDLNAPKGTKTTRIKNRKPLEFDQTINYNFPD